MTSRNGQDPPAVDDIRDEVLTLSDEGLSVRKIAQALGTSKSTVQRIITEAREAEEELLEELDADERAVLEELDPDYEPQPPFVFCGVEPGNGRTADDWRYLDSAGHPASEQDIYRCVQALECAGKWDEAAAIERDLDAQYAAAAEREGLYREDYPGNFHVWRLRGEVLS